jgi:hypothetical protein
VVFEARGRTSAHDVLSGYSRLIDQFFLVWQYHFEMLNIGYGAYVTFFQFCKEAFPQIEDQTIAKMVAGIEVLTFRPDEELQKLARRAIDLGVAQSIDGAPDPDGAFAQLERDDAGRAWLEAFEAAKVDPDVKDRILNRGRARKLAGEPAPKSLDELRASLGPNLPDEELLLRIAMPSERVDAMVAARTVAS